jgi:hypothetical protein
MAFPRPDYYALIGTGEDVDEATIKKAFVEKARALIEAYQILSDKEARNHYDHERTFGAQDSSVASDATSSNLPVPVGRNVFEPEGDIRNLIVSLDGRTMLPGTKITKRLLSRIPVDAPVAVFLPDGSVRDGRLKDLSGTGARMTLQADLAPESILEIGVSRQAQPFVLAQVVRVVHAGREFGVKWIQVFEKRLPKGMLSDEVL